MKPFLVVLISVLSAICLVYATAPPAPPPIPVEINTKDVVIRVEEPPARSDIALEHARQATFLLALPYYKISGSAVLIGRKKNSEGYTYRALTAHHVVRKMSNDLIKGGDKIHLDVDLVFQPNFHGEPLKISLKLNDIDWTSVVEDWASFTFDSNEKLTCVEVGTEKEFKNIKSFERIIAVGCGGGYTQVCRHGIIGSTHNLHVYVDGQKKYGKDVWDKQPTKFFRPYVNMWYGDSGGGIFDKYGKLIGIITGFGMMGTIQPVTHSVIAIKAFIIRDLAQADQDFFLIED